MFWINGSNACARMGGLGQAQYGLLVPVVCLAQSFFFPHKYHKTLIGGNERATRVPTRLANDSERRSEAISRERAGGRFITERSGGSAGSPERQRRRGARLSCFARPVRAREIQARALPAPLFNCFETKSELGKIKAPEFIKNKKCEEILLAFLHNYFSYQVPSSKGKCF